MVFCYVSQMVILMYSFAGSETCSFWHFFVLHFCCVIVFCVVEEILYGFFYVCVETDFYVL